MSNSASSGDQWLKIASIFFTSLMPLIPKIVENLTSHVTKMEESVFDLRLGAALWKLERDWMKRFFTESPVGLKGSFIIVKQVKSDLSRPVALRPLRPSTDDDFDVREMDHDLAQITLLVESQQFEFQEQEDSVFNDDNFEDS